MRKYFFILMLSIFTIQVSAQIEMFDESQQIKEVPKAEPYDSLRNMATQKFGTKNNFKYTFDHLIGQTLLYCGDPYSFSLSNNFKVGSYYKVQGTLPDDVGRGLYCRMQLEDTKTGEKLNEGGLTGDNFNARWVVVGHYEKNEIVIYK